MSKDKNYTDEQVKRMLAVYDPKGTVEERLAQVTALSKEFGKPNNRSVIAKLSREQVYIPAVKVSKVTGETPTTKEDLVKNFEDIAGVERGTFETMGKANKLAITAAIKSMAHLLAELSEYKSPPESDETAEDVDNRESVTAA